MSRLVSAKLAVFIVVAVLSPLTAQAAAPPSAHVPSNQAQIRVLLDRWAKAFHDRDINAIMAMYKPGPEMVAYDLVPPLQYVGYDAYKRDYENFLAQYNGPINVEYRDMHVVASATVAFAFGLERMSGTLVNGQKSEMWLRFTSGFRKIHGRWLDIHDHISVPADLDSGKAMMALTP